MKKTICAAALIAFAAAAPALAQSAASYIEIESEDQVVSELNLTVEQIEDMDVYDASGEEIGEVEEVLGGSDGVPTTLAVEVGGFLDIGDTDALVELSEVTVVDDRLQIDMTREEIEALPTWDD
jgi:sporulation protein YlmC with PRC-barrel domain